jgi:hypothetical protein
LLGDPFVAIRQTVAAIQQDPVQVQHVDELRGELNTIEAGEAIVIKPDD